MFYCIDLLRKNGKFSVIWLAATKENSLRKRDFMLVCLGRTCSDLKDYILHERNRPRLSLYLSSQLLFGTIKVYSRQIRYLLGDTMELFMRIRYQSSEMLDLQVDTPKRGKKRKSVDSKYLIELPMMDMIGFDINSSLNLPSISELPTMDEFLFLNQSSLIEDPLAHTVSREEITMIEEPFNIPRPEIESFGDEEIFKSHTEKDISKDYLSNIEEPSTIRKTDQPEFIPMLNPKAPPPMTMSSVVMGTVIEPMPRMDICLPPLTEASTPRRKRKRYGSLIVDRVTQLSKDDIKKNIRDTSHIVRSFTERIDVHFVSADSSMNRPMRSCMPKIPSEMMKLNMNIHPRLTQDGSPEANPLSPQERKILPVRRKLDLPKHMSTPIDRALPAGEASKSESSLMQTMRDASSLKDSLHISKPNLSTISRPNLSSISKIQEVSAPQEQLMLEESLRESFIEEQLMESVVSVRRQRDVSMPTFEGVVTRLMTEYKHLNMTLTFGKICPTSMNRRDAVKCFTELLDGMKVGKWRCHQEKPFGEIEIYN